MRAAALRVILYQLLSCIYLLVSPSPDNRPHKLLFQKKCSLQAMTSLKRKPKTRQQIRDGSGILWENQPAKTTVIP